MYVNNTCFCTNSIDFIINITDNWITATSALSDAAPFNNSESSKFSANHVILALNTGELSEAMFIGTRTWHSMLRLRKANLSPESMYHSIRSQARRVTSSRWNSHTLQHFAISLRNPGHSEFYLRLCTHFDIIRFLKLLTLRPFLWRILVRTRASHILTKQAKVAIRPFNS